MTTASQLLARRLQLAKYRSTLIILQEYICQVPLFSSSALFGAISAITNVQRLTSMPWYQVITHQLAIVILSGKETLIRCCGRSGRSGGSLVKNQNEIPVHFYFKVALHIFLSARECSWTHTAHKLNARRPHARMSLIPPHRKRQLEIQRTMFVLLHIWQWWQLGIAPLN